MARGSILKRCKICRRDGRSGFDKCAHKEAQYIISYRVGKKQKRETIGSNKKEAEKILTQRLSEINHGTYQEACDITFNEFIDKWLDEYALPRIKAHTLYKYKNTLKCHVRPVLGDYPE